MTQLSDCIDAHITGIAVTDPPGGVEIVFRSSASVCFSMIAEGVDRLAVSEFREANIVDKVFVWDSRSDPQDYRELLTAVISGRSARTVHMTWTPIVESEVELIKAGRKVLVEIQPVFGARVALLARNIDLVASAA